MSQWCAWLCPKINCAWDRPHETALNQSIEALRAQYNELRFSFSILVRSVGVVAFFE